MRNPNSSLKKAPIFIIRSKLLKPFLLLGGRAF
jgi:hypothetical protein